MKAVIFGATSAIAREVARLWAREGAMLFLAARNREKLSALEALIASEGGKVAGTALVDLNATDRHADLIRKAEEKLAGIEVALIAQGEFGDPEGSLRDFAQAESLLRTNLVGPVSLCTALVQIMGPRRRGTIAVISSVAGDRPRAVTFVYGAAKAGLSAYLAALRAKLRGSGLRIVTIKPGVIDTPMTAHLRRSAAWSTPDRIAPAIVRAIKKGRAVAYVPGWWRWVMLAVRAIPDALWSRLR